MTTAFLELDIVRDEGTRYAAYPDPGSPLAKAMLAGRPTAGLSGAPWTIGNGHTGREIHEGLVWTQAEVDAARRADIAAVRQGLDTALPWWRTLSDLRQDCLVNQAFNMGVHGLLGFGTYLGLVKAGQYAGAAQDELHTLWATQVGVRAVRLARQMASNVHQSLPA
ncbi:MAG: glycoside hydrolase family protein [Caulobacteraceae bacterium]|nr:glycoside hydrolase family protein [Caulobacteraceae bacterium]